MSLLSEALEAFHMLDRTTVSDGYGGFTSAWVKGAEFKAVAVFDSSIQARIAAVQGVTSLYTVTTEKTVNLQPYDVIMRDSDEKIFRVTSDGTDKKTPASASLNMRQVTAQEYTLPGVLNEQSTSNS